MPRRLRRPVRRAAAEPDDFEWILAPWDWALSVPARLGRALARGWSAGGECLRNERAARWFLLLLLAALTCRLWRPDWYSQHTFHPDERWLFEKTAQLSWPGEPGRDDPAGMQYGSLPLYVVGAAKDLATHVSHVSDYDAVIVWGRTITGCVDALTVAGVFCLAWMWAGPWPALLAALLVACAPLHILFAHFFTVDPWLACFAIFTLLACARLARGPSTAWSVAAGVLYAAALASKSSGLPLALPIMVAHLAPALVPGLSGQERRKRLSRAGVGLGAAALATLAAFFAFMPWAFLDFHKFLANQTAQRDILVTGSPMGTPFVRQYWDTGAFFHLKNFCLFYLGLPAGFLALLAVPGMAFVAGARVWRAWRPALVPARPKAAASYPDSVLGPVLLLSWVLPYFAIIDGSFAKFARYMLPILPALAVLLVLGLGWLRTRAPRTAWILVASSAVMALGYGSGYFFTYLHPHPWIESSAWLYDHVPAVTDDASAPGGRRATRILNEDWGDDLPLGLPGRVNGYADLKDQPGQVNIVEWDSANKLARFCQSLSQADVLILADPRAYGTYLRLPRRFPLTYTYYRLLFTDPGRLGFTLAHDSSNPVRLFGLFPLADSRVPSTPQWRWADESFSLYDRPHAFLFRRAVAMSPDQVREALMGALRRQGLSERFLDGVPPDQLDAAALGSNPALPSPSPPAAGDAAVLPGGRVNVNYGLSRGALAPLGNPACSVLVWWLLVGVLGWLALPLAVRLFRGFPAGGYALSRALGVFLFGWLAYNLAWLFPRAWPFWQGRLWLLLAALAALVAHQVRARRKEAAAWLKANRAEVLFTEAVFAGAFLLFVLIRLYNPDIHDVMGQGYFGGGEPLGMTYLSALTRCATFPAYDPWLALANSSYYYFGYVLAATLTKLSGFSPTITYNLSLALFFSLTLVGAFGLLRVFTTRRWLALGGAAMVAMAGSLWTAAYVAIQASRGLMTVWGAVFSHGFIWDPTRFPDLVQGHIFEFPFFSYLYGDLHPHNIALGFSVLLAALLLKPFLQARPGWRSFGRGPGEALLWLLVTALVLDAQYAINTWSWPVFLALGAVCMLIGPWAGKGLSLGRRFAASAWGLLFLGASLAVGWALMFGFSHYFLQDGVNRFGWVHPGEWQMSAYIPLAYYLPGLLALAALGGLRLRDWAGAASKSLGYSGRARGLDRLFILVPRYLDRRPWSAALLGTSLAVVAGLLLWATAHWQSQGVWALASGLGLACLVLFGLGGAQSGAEAFLWILGCAFCFMVAGVEFVYVADRMNTIFKVWMNGWVFMGLAFGGAFALAFERIPVQAAPRPVRGRGRRARAGFDWVRRLPVLAALGLVLAVFLAAWADAGLLDRGGRFLVSYLLFGLLMLGALFGGLVYGRFGWWKGVLKGLFFGLLALGLLYPLGAAGRRIWEASQFRDPHLDGLRFMADCAARPGAGANDYDRYDYALISWLNKNADVTETVAEAPGLELYQGFDRISIYTGLPTLLGWDYQVGQQLGPRAGGVLDERKRDAAVIYGPDEKAAAAVLRRYRVRWIVVGTLERKLYPAAGLDKFARMGVVAAKAGPSVLYRYDWDKP